ncbi:Maltoporin [Gossypium arboreum]|uniref:Maltoporin n=1 Tax=Gossypium arboreum TaxID=29729 RepID=A0A0B0MAY2_GOSAR|nr:Maltoporin [Gossypium arboreum]
MASGSSGRGNTGNSKGFDFGSDDILCSYEDYGNQESSNGNHTEPNSSNKLQMCGLTSVVGEGGQGPLVTKNR